MKKVLVVLGMFMAGAAGVSYSAEFFNPATGHLYAIVNSGSNGAWINAENNAIALGGHLVTINDAAEESWLKSTFGDTQYWIGFNDAAVEGTWVWSSGESVTYTNWNEGEPNNSTPPARGEDFAVLNWDEKWNDWDHERPGYTYINGIAEFVMLDALIISPDMGGNTGVVTVTIIGRGFQEGAIPKLRKAGESDIVGINTIYSSNSITTTFDLTDKKPGNWDVVVKNLDGELPPLVEGFTIVQDSKPKLWVDIVGREQIRVGREQIYWIRFGNAGNVNAYDCLIPVKISSGCSYKIDVSPTSEFLTSDGTATYIYIPVLKPNEEKVVKLYLKSNNTGKLEISNGIISLFDELPNIYINRLAGKKVSTVQSSPPWWQWLKDLLEIFGIEGININSNNTNITIITNITNEFYFYNTNITVIGAFDPNDKVGPTGFGESHYVNPSIYLQYVIYFENVGTATAPAQEIKLADQLNSDLDWTTLEFGDICIGDKIIEMPEKSKQISTSTIISMGTWSGGTPETDTVRLQIQASITATGTVQWILEGRDINTGELTDLLVPNTDPPYGEGWVSFTIKPKQNLSSNTQIRNKASIIFDTNQPIDTPEVYNTIDADFPTSTITAVSKYYTSTTFVVNYSGEDSHSGVRSFTIYVSDNGSPYIPWHTETLDTPTTTFSGSLTYTGKYGHSYKFYSRAIDAVSNYEPVPNTVQAKTTIIATTIRIEADRRVIPVNGTTTLYCFAQEGTETVPATWTVTNGTGILLTNRGTSTIFTATTIGRVTIKADDGTNTATITIIVGYPMSPVTPQTITAGFSFGSITLFGITAIESYILPQAITPVNLSGNIGGIGIEVNAYGSSGTKVATATLYVEIGYNERVLGNIEEETLRLWVSSDGNTWEEVIPSGVDTVRNIVYGTITHLSYIAPAGFASDLSKAFAYPNPYYADRHSYIWFGDITENSTIQIFTIAGELVREIKAQNSPQSWDVRNSAGEKVASGIYIYLIKDSAGHKKTGKLGVIR